MSLNKGIDISALALEASLTAMKGTGWTVESLKAIYDAIASLNNITAASIWAVTTRNLTNPATAQNLGNMQVDGLTNSPSGTKTWALASQYTETRAGYLDKIPKTVCSMIFWSDVSALLSITDSSASLNCNNVVVTGLPSGVTIIRVVALLKIQFIRDTSASDNAINNASMTLKVDADSGYTSTVTAIDIPDNSWAVDVSTSPDLSGDIIEGDNNIKTEVTENATYYVRFENAQADGANLELHGVQVGLKIYFTV